MEHKMTITATVRDFVEVVERAYERGESTLVLRSGVAVARVVPIPRQPLLGRELVKLWRKMSHLTPKEAEEFDKELQEARSKLGTPVSKWD